MERLTLVRINQFKVGLIQLKVIREQAFVIVLNIHIRQPRKTKALNSSMRRDYVAAIVCYSSVLHRPETVRRSLFPGFVSKE